MLPTVATAEKHPPSPHLIILAIVASLGPEPTPCPASPGTRDSALAPSGLFSRRQLPGSRRMALPALPEASWFPYLAAGLFSFHLARGDTDQGLHNQPLQAKNQTSAGVQSHTGALESDVLLETGPLPRTHHGETLRGNQGSFMRLQSQATPSSSTALSPMSDPPGAIECCKVSEGPLSCFSGLLLSPLLPTTPAPAGSIGEGSKPRHLVPELPHQPRDSTRPRMLMSEGSLKLRRAGPGSYRGQRQDRPQ